MKKIIFYFLILVILQVIPLKIYAQLGAIGEFIGIGDNEEENLGAVRTMSGSVMEKGKTGVGFIYQYLRFVAFEGNDLATAFVNENKYDFRKYEIGKSYFISHGVTDKLTLSIFVNDFFIQGKYFTYTDSNKNKVIDSEEREYHTENHQDLNQVWLQNTYQVLRKTDRYKLAFNNILRFPTAYDENISNDAVGVYLGFCFSRKIFKTFLLADAGYNYYNIATNSGTGQIIEYYPGDNTNCHLALIYPVSPRFTFGGELTGNYFFKRKTTSGKSIGNEYDGIDFSPTIKFKITNNTVFYTSISYTLRDKRRDGYDYGYIFGVNYLFE